LRFLLAEAVRFFFVEVIFPVDPLFAAELDFLRVV